MLLHKKEIWAKTEEGVVKIKKLMIDKTVKKANSINMIQMIESFENRKRRSKNFVVSINKKYLIGHLKVGIEDENFKKVIEMMDEKNIILWKKKSSGRKPILKKIKELKDAQ